MISIVGLHTMMDQVNKALRDCEADGVYVNLKITSPDGTSVIIPTIKTEISYVAGITRKENAT